MPNNTQDGYANAFLGNFNSYSEGGRIVGNFWYTDIEAFMQDNWRVSRRVTLDFGIRFYHQLPTENLDYNTTDWVRSTYNPAQAMRLYYPGCTVSTATKACPTANQVAVDPMTGYTTFFALQGTFVPASVGGYSTTPTPFPGMERATGNNPNLPLTLWNVHSVLPAVRFGIAWDVFGNGKTAIRTGFGQFYNLGSTQIAQNSSGNPPDTYNRADLLLHHRQDSELRQHRGHYADRSRWDHRQSESPGELQRKLHDPAEGRLRDGAGSRLCVQSEQAHAGSLTSSTPFPCTRSTTPPTTTRTWPICPPTPAARTSTDNYFRPLRRPGRACEPSTSPGTPVTTPCK